jgi:hypothetical protein
VIIAKLPAAHALVTLHQECLAHPGWPLEEPEAHDALLAAVVRNHAYNSRLWDEEDLARRTDVDDRAIVANKRNIDRFNQVRNDAAEQIDEQFQSCLAERLNVNGRRSSETPGAMIDRLSILALKIRAMHAQVARTDAAPSHRDACAEKLARLTLQRDELAESLARLLSECVTGQAWFRVYRQFKMYNDPVYRQ